MDRDEPIRGHGLSLPLQLKRLQRLNLDRVAHKRQGRFAEQDITWTRRLLQARRDVDRIARREALLGARHNLAGIDPDPRLQAQLRQSVPHLHRRADGAQGVVLAHLGNAEHGHHRVADELLDRPAVQLDDALHPLEVAGKQGTQGLGIRRPAQRSRAGDVAEQQGHRLALLARNDDWSGALLAELGPVAVLVPAGQTAPHALRLTRTEEEPAFAAAAPAVGRRYTAHAPRPGPMSVITARGVGSRVPASSAR